LQRTAALWPDVIYAWRWVHAAAHILGNEDGDNARMVQRRFDGLMGAMSRHAHHAGTLSWALEHFVHVARCWHTGLFHCYTNAELPRTNNDLEQLFGSYRYHERRTTGRKAASPATVLRGAVRLLAATATRGRLVTARELAHANRQRWSTLRAQLEKRRRARVQRTRFRRDPKQYLAELEQLACQLTLLA
jgi:hypothetical protein